MKNELKNIDELIKKTFEQEAQHSFDNEWADLESNLSKINNVPNSRIGKSVNNNFLSKTISFLKNNIIYTAASVIGVSVIIIIVANNNNKQEQEPKPTEQFIDIKEIPKEKKTPEKEIVKIETEKIQKDINENPNKEEEVEETVVIKRITIKDTVKIKREVTIKKDSVIQIERK